MSSTTSSSCLRESVQIGISKRTDFSLHRDKVALLIIDVQRYCCNAGSTCSSSDDDHHHYDSTEYYQTESLPRMMSNIERLLETFRTFRDLPSKGRNGCEVIFTAIQSLTMDGRDISLDYKLSGPFFQQLPKVNTSLDDIFLPNIRPQVEIGKGDIYIPKTASSVFHSTNIDYVLRNLNMEQLVIVGQITEQCVESAVRNAADMGYFVTVVHDACASYSQEKHNQGLAGMSGYCRIVNPQLIMDELGSCT